MLLTAYWCFAAIVGLKALVTCFFIDTPKDVEELFRATWVLKRQKMESFCSVCFCVFGDSRVTSPVLALEDVLQPLGFCAENLGRTCFCDFFSDE